MKNFAIYSKHYFVTDTTVYRSF
ncbi:uncharacterized protein METZ01_LOCUS209053 [marine metagenome]|uniref:Uncharacterized protein n=1 Tax=marine metagenome TaxID=408172 RepID=A0A382F0J9_9ZZZZ